ncbi:MAG: Short-chain dehydrogenase [Actinomycetia bacterium]|nr:Short-chain dehydrogenase [Actinomycetes bacterium]
MSAGERLAGEVAVVTGSTHGIGRATAITFASEGASVVVTGRDADAGAEVLERICEVGGKGLFVLADLLDPAVGEQIVDAALRVLGPPSILVNNAASSDLVRNGTDRAVSEIEDAAWERILATNLTGPIRITRAVLGPMIRGRGGSIVNISSHAARVGVPGIDGYTAVKGAMESLTRSWATEYAEYGVRCNCIQVSFVQVVDERKGRASLDADNDPRFKSLILTRGGRPPDVAKAALYLVSSDAEFVTGIVMPVDGGAAAMSGMPWVTAKPSTGADDVEPVSHWSTVS